MYCPDQKNSYVRVRSLENKHKKPVDQSPIVERNQSAGPISLERTPTKVDWVQIQTLTKIRDVHNSAVMGVQRLLLERPGAHLGDRPLGTQVLLHEGTEVDSKPTRLH